MVNNYTPGLKRRSDDVYSPAGIPGRPDRATIVYTNKLHELFPDTPIVIGGIEASLRRFAHYDYWQDVPPVDPCGCPADLLVFGGRTAGIGIAGLLSGEHKASYAISETALPWNCADGAVTDRRCHRTPQVRPVARTKLPRPSVSVII
jgi:hypothetical protein